MSAHLSKRKSNKTRPPTRRLTKRKSTKRGSLPKIFNYIKYAFVVVVAFGFIGTLLWAGRLNKQFVGAESAGSLDQSYTTLLYIEIDELKADPPKVNKVVLYTFDKVNKKVVTSSLEAAFVITEVEKYGDVAVKDIYSLGMLTGDQSSIDAITYFKSVAFNLYGLPIDRYILTETAQSYIWDPLLTRGNYLAFLNSLLTEGKSESYFTDLQLDEIYQNAGFVQGLPDDRIVEVTMANFDDTVREITLDSAFAHAAKNIAVLNGGEKSGIAGFGARVIKNLGGRVVSVVNSDIKFGESFIVSDDLSDPSTVLLARTFEIPKVLTKAQAQEYIGSNDLYRADILLVLVD